MADAATAAAAAAAVTVWWLALAAAAGGLVLDGTYGQFRKWNAGVNGTLEMEFRTRQPNGLLMYTDDGGTYDFFELKMVEGTMRLRYNLGAGAQILMAGHDLYDGRWHHVAVERRGRVTALSVDNATAAAATAGKELQFGRLASNSAVYVGGMPGWYNGRLTRLALPSVIFEPRFTGAVRNVVYADDFYPYPRRQTPTVTEPVRRQLKVRYPACGGFFIYVFCVFPTREGWWCASWTVADADFLCQSGLETCLNVIDCLKINEACTTLSVLQTGGVHVMLY